MIREGRGRQLLPLKSGWSDNFQYAILETDSRSSDLETKHIAFDQTDSQIKNMLLENGLYFNNSWAILAIFFNQFST
jgi:hypothetical protein